jgi:hypothetical protein
MLKKQHNQAHDSLSDWQVAAQMLHDACHGVSRNCTMQTVVDKCAEDPAPAD